MTLHRIVSRDIMPHKASIIELINTYAQSIGLQKKDGAFFHRDGTYAGSIYTIGKMAGVDMMEWK